MGLQLPRRTAGKPVAVRRMAALAAVGISVLVLGGCSSETKGEWERFAMPDPASQQGERILSLWQGAWIAALITGVIVWGLIFYAIIVFRRRSDDEIPVQTRYNLPLEIFYTIAPVIMVVVFFAHTVETQNYVLDKDRPNDNCMEIVGQQWSWTFNYGIGDKGNVRAMILNAARGTLVVPGPGRTEKSLVHVSKVAEAISRAVHSTHRGTYLVADPKPPTMRQLADSITRALGRAPVRSVPIAPLLLAARVVDTGLKLLRRRPQDVTGLVQKSQFRTVFDPSKYERTFEHSLHTDLDASIREEVEWLRSIGTIR